MVGKHFEAVALANSYPPLLVDDYNRIGHVVSKEFRWYLIGLTCSLAEKKILQADELNLQLTREQVAKNSGCAKETLRRYICYANSIIRLEESMPELAADILAGRTRLGLKTTLILLRLPPSDIVEIMQRINSEDTPIRQIIMEHTGRPLSYPRRFRDGRNTKYSPKSVKELPRHDPDALITGLTFTIPSWTKAIKRVHLSSDMSKPAQNKLNDELASLNSAISALVGLLTEANQ